MILIEFWGDLKNFAQGETRAIFEGEGAFYEIVDDNYPVMVIDVKKWEPLKRAGFIRFVSKFLASGDSIPKIDLNLEDFAVRARRYDPSGLKSDFVEREIGRMVRGKVNLTSPKNVVRVAISKRIHIGILLYDFLQDKFEERKGSNLPISYPITMHPRFARALINLARLKRGNKIMDPFCGTGSILVEAGLMGMRVYGSDIDERMIFASKKNISKFGVHAELNVMDVGEISGSYDAVVTDPPYGRSSSSKGEKIESLYGRAFKKFSELVDKVAIVLPSKRAMEIGKKYFELREFYPVRVHKSLTRYYCYYAR